MAKTKHSKDRPRKKDRKSAPKHGKARGKAAKRTPSKHRPKAAAKAKGAPVAKVKPSAPADDKTGAGKALAGAAGSRPAKEKAKSARKSSRRPTLLRRGPNGEILAPGDLLLPGGTQRIEEVQYLFRGCSAAAHFAGADEAIGEVFARRPQGDFPADRDELQKLLGWARDRFERGNIEPVIPARSNLRRSFQGVVDRTRQRRREIGAFLRGLDLGRTESSHMDSHGEASLQSLMEWAARLENLAEADEPNQADYAQFHRGLDQLESKTEELMIDVEQTLRRVRDRLRG